MQSAFNFNPFETPAPASFPVPTQRFRKEIERFSLDDEAVREPALDLPFSYERDSILPRFFIQTDLARPTIHRQFVRNHKIEGLKPGLEIHVTGELFDQSDVTFWLKLFKYMKEKNFATIKAIDLLKERGYKNPNLSDYLAQKAILYRFANTSLNISYTGPDNRRIDFCGPMLIVSNHYAFNDEEGAVYYDDQRGHSLGRIDQFNVTIPAEVVKMLEEGDLRSFIKLSSRHSDAPPHALWLSLIFPSVDNYMRKSSIGYRISLSKLKDYSGSEASDKQFEQQISKALDYLVRKDEISRWNFCELTTLGRGVQLFRGNDQDQTTINEFVEKPIYRGLRGKNTNEMDTVACYAFLSDFNTKHPHFKDISSPDGGYPIYNSWIVETSKLSSIIQARISEEDIKNIVEKACFWSESHQKERPTIASLKNYLNKFVYDLFDKKRGGKRTSADKTESIDRGMAQFLAKFEKDITDNAIEGELIDSDYAACGIVRES